MNLTLAAAFLVGLVGSVHCLGMCGGIAGALSLGTADRRRWLAPLANSAGRVATYALAGALVGGIGWSLGEMLGWVGWAHVLVWFTALLFVLMGLSLVFTWPALGVLERAGAHLWRRLQAPARRVFAMRGPAGAFVAGLIWGWLPCGLVYTMLAAAAASGSPLGGAALMVSFGLGTSLAMVTTGFAAGSGSPWLRQRLWLRRPVGLLLIGIGVLAAAAPGVLMPGGHHGAADHHSMHGQIAPLQAH